MKAFKKIQQNKIFQVRHKICPISKERGFQINLKLTGSFSGLCLLNPGISRADQNSTSTAPVSGYVATAALSGAEQMRGMDEAVNEHLAQAAGRPAREPFINTEAMGDLWNMLLLLAGGICGFIIGRWWHLLWGKGS